MTGIIISLTTISVSYTHLEVSPPLIYTPLKIIPELQYFLNGSITYLKGDKVCRDLLSLKRKELAFVLGYYYSDYDLSSLVHPLSKYVNSFQYFVIQNYKKVKTVEEMCIRDRG